MATEKKTPKRGSRSMKDLKPRKAASKSIRGGVALTKPNVLVKKLPSPNVIGPPRP